MSISHDEQHLLTQQSKLLLNVYKISHFVMYNYDKKKELIVELNKVLSLFDDISKRHNI